MRLLKRNGKTFYKIIPLIEIEDTDSDGFLTGDKIVTNFDVVTIKLSTYPANGLVRFESFGDIGELDIVATGIGYELSVGDRLHLSIPKQYNVDEYDYSVSKIMTSLNSTTYILKSRV